MAQMNDDGSSNGIDLSSHSTGDPFPRVLSGGVTVGHTWLILVLILVVLWMLGFSFRSVRL